MASQVDTAPPSVLRETFTPRENSAGSVDTSINDNSGSDAEALQAGDADIAIIGMACRVPGSNNSTAELWQYLLDKGDASGTMPAMRWEPYNHRHPRNAAILSRTTSTGYFLDRIEDFDASFFAVSPREAEQIDPQQRITLEVAWEALEDAGIPADSLSGSDTSVFMGVNSDDYGKLVLEDLEGVGAHMGVGTAYCGIPSRVSYHLNLFGPSVAVDAACASSLVAVHNARAALLAGETKLALAGGVNALIGPGLTRVLDEAGAIASDGKCRSFDDSAHGYGRGEGAGIVVLKKLSKALADGDRIHAVLKGSAVAADGRTVGIMAPNPAAQQLVAQKALREARTPAETISYIEAHATSTPLGDPTEMAALAEVYGQGARRGTDGTPSCQVGSIKSNIGHLEAAAGVMGLIKAAMVLNTGVVPGQANLETLSTKIDWANNGMTVSKEATQLADSPFPRRAAVASYGYSGTVSHAILEATPDIPAPSTAVDISEGADQPALLILSGPQESRIPKAAAVLADWLASSAGAAAPLQHVADTLARHRSHHRFRLAITAADKDKAISLLQKVAKGETDKLITSGRVSSNQSTNVGGAVWIFSGHGAQWPAMGQELATQPAFAKAVQQLEPIVQAELDGFSVSKALEKGEEGWTSDEVQVLTFALHIGLASVLTETAGPPSAIVGHSLGETAAAVVAGAISLEDGARLVTRRAKLYRRHMGKGAMALVSLGIDEVRQKLDESTEYGDVDIAIDTSPTSCVVAGPSELVTKLSEQWKSEGVQVRAVKSDMAFHSRMLHDLMDPLREGLSGFNFWKPKIKLYSTSAQDTRSTSPRDVEYWVNNMIAPVRLREVTQALAEDGYRTFVEVSAHPIVAHSISETLEAMELDSDVLVLPAMIRNQPVMERILTTVGSLHVSGQKTAYTSHNAKRPWLPEVPRTTWNHEPYWRTVAKVPLNEVTAHKPENNTLLGTRTAIWGTGNVLYTTTLEEESRPYPGRHPLHGSEIVPAAVLINTFLHAIDAETSCLEGMSLKVPVMITPARQIQILLSNQQQISLTSRLADSAGGAWLVNTTSRIMQTAGDARPERLDLEKLQARLQDKLADNFSIDYLDKVGVSDMGFPWAVTSHKALGDEEFLACVETNPNNGDSAGLKDLGASIMDAATSIASTIFFKDPLLRMPTAVDRIMKYGPLETLQEGWIYCKRSQDQSKPFAVDVLVSDATGNVLVEFVAMAFAGLENDAVSRKSTRGLVHKLAWPPAKLAETPITFSNVVLFSTEHGGKEPASHKRYTRQLTTRGYTVSVAKDVKELASLGADTIVLNIAPSSDAYDSAMDAASAACSSLVSAAQAMAASPDCKATLFSLVPHQEQGDAEEMDLASAPLYGLARIIKSEHPELFGGLFETTVDDILPLGAIRYVHGENIVKQDVDGVARVGRLRPFSADRKDSDQAPRQLRFSPAGTYLITGGLGALGLVVAKWMVDRGARRLLLVSRRSLPKRSQWADIDAASPYRGIIDAVMEMEAEGATVHVLPVDISVPNSSAALASAIDALSLPRVTGVVHAAGVLIDQMVQDVDRESFDAVLAPKLNGALALDELFPPGTLDFFTLFSSCGQLLGFPGQASYAAANACLDAVAQRRRARGDKGANAILWTSWRGMGMAASTEYINAELEARGISDVTAEEAFLAWDRIVSADKPEDDGLAVVLRALPINHDEEVAHPILEDAAPRKPPPATAAGDAAGDGAASAAPGRPTSGPELEQWLNEQLRAAVADTLGMAPSDVDAAVALAEMGMDSVLTVSFRTRVQKTLKVKMGPTLAWKCPTIGHLVKHFAAELQA
ncbi:6-methylsalicylic acid synthase [Trichoderma chlorosporum]